MCRKTGSILNYILLVFYYVLTYIHIFPMNPRLWRRVMMFCVTKLTHVRKLLLGMTTIELQ